MLEEFGFRDVDWSIRDQSVPRRNFLVLMMPLPLLEVPTCSDDVGRCFHDIQSSETDHGWMTTR